MIEKLEHILKYGSLKSIDSTGIRSREYIFEFQYKYREGFCGYSFCENKDIEALINDVYEKVKKIIA